MKTFYLFIASAFLLSSCAGNKQKPLDVTVVTENLIYPEGVIEYDGSILSTNFGVSEFNPLNNECKGYITSYKNGKNEVFIPCDSSLSAPKGMGIHNNHLFICDVNKVVVYDLKDKSKTGEIKLPEGELMVNDVCFVGNDMYATSTLTGNIFKFDVEVLDSLCCKEAKLYTNVPGANGIYHRDGVIYVASFDPDSKPKAENLIYKMNVDTPENKSAIVKKAGLYDSIDITKDGKILYYSNWADKEIGRVDLETLEVTTANLSEENICSSPGDIAIIGDYVVVPDLLFNKIKLIPLF